MTQTWYLIEPAAPLVFRSGKPFGAGSRDGANFPWPSAMAGLLRTQVMDARGLNPKHDVTHKDELLALPAAGPWLARRTGEAIEPWLPKPADAVLLKDDTSGKLQYHRLAPGRFADGTGADLPGGLLPVAFAKSVKGKPQPGPAWWPLTALLRWMQGQPVAPDEVAHDGDAAPWCVERRTHVGIDRETLASENGKLFQTEGLDFGARRIDHDGRPGGWDDHRFVMLARGPAGIEAGAVTFGGERRLSWLATHVGEGIGQPKDWAASLRKGLALTAITPAIFAGGWKPAWLDDALEGEVPGIPGLRVRLRAAALERWQGISGWDLAAWKPRAARKAVPAGATYWFDVIAGDASQFQQLWLAPISDAEQDRRDGFGIVLPRAWNPSNYGEHRA